ncbi:MAG TPA: EAL domain-containing protein, partial [Candidatus Sulfomarinibacteraceae bacterium]|nr:EAL domain-containing protein [Candidatus Sulfomarinibacteraceae bacterium]
MTTTAIMIVEDEGVVAMHLAKAVAGWGYRVTAIAATADQALRAAEGDPPDLVLMDIGLRGEADGIEAATQLRARSPIPVIYLTAFGDEATIERAKATEPYGYALKPINERELKVTIEMALCRHRADQALREQREWFDLALSSAGDAMIATDTEGRVTYISDDASGLTGWSREDASGVDVAHILRSPGSSEEVANEHFVRRAIRKHSVVSRAAGSMLLTKSGAEVPLEGCAAPIRNGSGQVTGAVVVFRDAGERRRAEERLIHLAHHDALTGLANRVLFRERLHQAIARARRSHRLVAVQLLDLDNFKTVNDTLGHAAGDALLVAAAERVRGCVRETDTVARLGGDEIAVIQPDLEDLGGARALADKLVRVFNRPFEIADREVVTTASVGITVFPIDENDPDAMLSSADNAMYRAKSEGRNRFRLSGGGQFANLNGDSLSEAELRRAVERSELEVYLQPVFDVEGTRVTGAEALIRWNHPEHGLIPACVFIEIAERIGILGDVVDLSLHRACEAASRWSGPAAELRVSVNLSGSQLQRRDLVDTVASALAASGLSPDRLELEIQERSTADRPAAEVSANILALRALGVRIAIDRFRGQFASILTMRTLPVATVKLDRSLVGEAAGDPSAMEVVRATVEISERLDITVIA